MTREEIKEIFGEVQDEFDDEETDIKKIDDNNYEICGKMRTDEFCELFNVDIDEVIGENNDNSLEIIQNRLDIFPIIWQYILVDVPLRVLHPDAKEEKKEGNGWRLITEDDEKEVIDPRLASLSKFIKE